MSVHSRTIEALRSASPPASNCSISYGVHACSSDPVRAIGRSARSTSTPTRPRRVTATTIISSVWLRLTSIWSHPRTYGRPPGW
ncbi:hypothetical protein ACFWBR_31450 [Streptomyces sp. NPDC060006]|uniref:hypothetical protein n=1 Tax=unclassified Streptomyces TaxID=2593676 RepID=UPI0036A47A1C